MESGLHCPEPYFANVDKNAGIAILLSHRPKTGLRLAKRFRWLILNRDEVLGVGWI
jgi:hypothetical protein